MASLQNTFKNHTKHNFKQEQVIQQVTKSPWKTMDEKGANTFPFHNLPRTQETISRVFIVFFHLSFWIKEKSVATLAKRNICDQTQNTQVSSPTVSQNWRLYQGNFNSGVTLGLDHIYLLSLFDLYALHYGSLFGFCCTPKFALSFY